MIQSEVGAEDRILYQIRQISSIKEAHIVYGVYDLIARLEANDMNTLKNEITEKIRKIDLIRGTLTMIIQNN